MLKQSGLLFLNRCFFNDSSLPRGRVSLWVMWYWHSSATPFSNWPTPPHWDFLPAASVVDHHICSVNSVGSGEAWSFHQMVLYFLMFSVPGCILLMTATNYNLQPIGDTYLTGKMSTRTTHDRNMPLFRQPHRLLLGVHVCIDGHLITLWLYKCTQ